MKLKPALLLIAFLALLLAIAVAGGGNGDPTPDPWAPLLTACAVECPTAVVLPLRPANATVAAQLRDLTTTPPPTAWPPLPTSTPPPLR